MSSPSNSIVIIPSVGGLLNKNIISNDDRADKIDHNLEILTYLDSLDDEGIVSLVASQELSVSSALHHSLEAVATHLSEHELKLFSEIARLSWRIVGAYLLR